MLYTEFSSEVKKLSSRYYVFIGPSKISVYYGKENLELVMRIARNLQYSFKRHVKSSQWDKLPFSHNLYMLSSELAVTPVRKR